MFSEELRLSSSGLRYRGKLFQRERQGIFKSYGCFGVAACVISNFRIGLCVEEVNTAHFPARQRVCDEQRAQGFLLTFQPIDHIVTVSFLKHSLLGTRPLLLMTLVVPVDLVLGHAVTRSLGWSRLRK